ncbi:hypothetical protein TrCOL_g2787 [Triparma columacea]|uniref:Uncharacterized protein n=1 Tax=Triparma columacea TaxID=722753 RepID=A0A9W7LCQ2_9STRA|nr:hypothetical protein TrCOL_g2787 [Triparma columacea]
MPFLIYIAIIAALGSLVVGAEGAKLSDYATNVSRTELTLGEVWDDVQQAWVCPVEEGDLSDLKGMKQLEVLRVTWSCRNVIMGDLADLQDLTKLRELDLGGLALVTGDLSSVEGLTSLTYLDLRGLALVTGDLSSVEGLTSLTYLDLRGLALVTGDLSSVEVVTSLDFLDLRSTSISGTLSTSLIARCSTSILCLITPAPMMCGEGQRLVGLICEPCQNCAANGECHFGMDESDYFCESCPIDSYKLGSQCTQCYAGSATVSSTNEIVILIIALVMEVAMQLTFVALEVFFILTMFSRWGEHYREIEREYSQLDEREKDATEDANYQLENMIPFCATFCQNYVPSQIDFEKKVFRMKVMCFMILQASSAGSTVTQLGECSSKGRMFGGSFREVRERLSSQRSRVNSAYSDNGERAGELFDEMITEDNVVAKMGSRRKIKDMFANSSLEEEKVRWSLAAGEEKLTWLGYVIVGIKVIFGGILAALLIWATIFYSCVFRIALISLQVLAVLSWVRVEWGYGFKDSYRRLMGCYHGGEQDNGASDGANDKDEIELAENPLHQEEKSTKGGGEGGGGKDIDGEDEEEVKEEEEEEELEEVKIEEVKMEVEGEEEEKEEDGMDGRGGTTRGDAKVAEIMNRAAPFIKKINKRRTTKIPQRTQQGVQEKGEEQAERCKERENEEEQDVPENVE